MSRSAGRDESPGSPARKRDAETDADVDDRDGEADTDAATDPETLRAQVRRLQQENDRLRREYARTRRLTYRRTALALGLVGVLALAAGVLFPTTRSVLFALGGTGLFGGVMIYYLTPGRFLTASVGERVYESASETEAAICAELGVSDHRIYVPRASPVTATLFVPQHEQYELPPGDDLDTVFVVPDDSARRGVAFTPTGSGLFRDFRSTLTGSLGRSPARLVDQLTDALVESFELVESAERDLDVANGRLSVETTGNTYADTTEFDHPVASFLAVGLANGLDEPIVVETTAGENPDALVVTCRWTPSDSDTGPSEAEATAEA